MNTINAIPRESIHGFLNHVLAERDHDKPPPPLSPRPDDITKKVKTEVAKFDEH